MAEPVEKKKKLSPASDHCCSSSSAAEIDENQQQQSSSLGSFVTEIGKRWVCDDVWMDILPHFDRPQLGLKLALLSPRFDELVDTHFNAQHELTLWRPIQIRKYTDAEKAKLNVCVCGTNLEFPSPILIVSVCGENVEFPLPDRPLPNNIRFENLLIEYVDYSVLEFLRSNQHVFERAGTMLDVNVYSSKAVDLFAEIYPIFEQNIRLYAFAKGEEPLQNLRKVISQTVLTDCARLNYIDSDWVLPDAIADDGPYANAAQALSMWLHTPSTDGQPKNLRCNVSKTANIGNLINKSKEVFRSATTPSGSYNIHFHLAQQQMPPIEPFELVNEQTGEKLALQEVAHYKYKWLLKRCPAAIVVGEAAPPESAQWEDEIANRLNNVQIQLRNDEECLGPL